MDCNRFVSLSIWMATCAGVAATGPAGCKDKGSGDGEGESSSTGSTQESSSADGATTTSGADETSSEGGTQGQDVSTGDPTVVVGGEVQDMGAGGAPIPGALISLLDMPGFETVSDAEGVYSLAPLPPSAEVTVLVQPTAEYLGSVIPLTTPTEDADGQPLVQISTATVNQQIMYLEAQGPQPADLDQAIIIVRLLQNSATSGGGATIDVQPPPMPGTYYAPDASGQPILDSSVIEFNLLPVVVYFNVAPGDAGVLAVTATHPERTCTIVHPEFPTIGGYVTLVDVDCPAP